MPREEVGTKARCGLTPLDIFSGFSLFASPQREVTAASPTPQSPPPQAPRLMASFPSSPQSASPIHWRQVAAHPLQR